MTAGRGVVHSERAAPAFRAAGGRMHGIQIWLALPVEHEDDAPSFEHHPRATLPAIAPAAGVRGRVLLGTAFGATSPIAHPSRPWLVDLELAANARIEVASDEVERAVFVIDGAIAVEGAALAANQLAVLAAGRPAGVVATTASRLLLLGGPPLGPRLVDWNFVSSSQAAIDRAREAWQAQIYPRIPGDDQEFTPYPGSGARR